MRRRHAKEKTALPHVFEWFNSCGSSAVAMRSYCPWVTAVLPHQYIPLTEGTRFSEPNRLMSVLSLVKEVSGIMGRALLIQHEAPKPPKQGITLFFTKTCVGEIEIPEYGMEC